MILELNEQPDWDAIQWPWEIWIRRFILKGLLAPRDADIAARQGIDGIVLSNHGRRQPDGAISPMETLWEICVVTVGRITVMIDSGSRRGSDVVKALAL